MKEKNGISLSGMGITALLVIFGVLALAVFALLSVSTAKAQVRLSEKTAQPVIAYYEAEAQAHEVLAQLRTGQVPQGVTEENGLFAYRCPIEGAQYLAVEVEVTEAQYRIIRWQVCTAQAWEAEDSLPVWQGIEKE